MRCLVTGITGFVGAALARELVARGHEVVGMARTGRMAAAASSGDVVTLVEAELGDPDTIAAAATECEVIFHCAGIASPRAHRRALEWVNIAGTENVVNAAREASVRRVVHLSCANVTLINADRIHWGESRVITQPPLDWHARTKLLAEEIALSASRQKLEVTALRPAWLWGQGDHTTLPLLCAEASNGGVRLHGDGDNLFATLHIDNLTAALITAATAKNAPGNAYYLADSDVLTAREFFDQLCRACGMSPPRRGVFAIDLAVAWLTERFTDNTSLVADVVRRGRGTLFDTQAAVRDLSFAPSIAVEAGMRALSEWVNQQGGAAAIAKLRRPDADARSVDAQVRLADEQPPT